MTKTIKPGGKQLFAKPVEADKRTASGIIIAGDNDKRFEPKFATVINVGNEVSKYHQQDTIVYKEYATTEIKLNDDDYILVDEADVLGTVVEV